MVAMAERTKWTDALMRAAINDFMERRLWTVNRLAAELAYPQGPLEMWLGGETALPKLRTKLHRMIDHFGIEPLDLDVSEGVEDSNLDGVYQESVDLYELPITGIAEATIDPDTGDITNLTLVPSPDNPLPYGFAILLPVRTGFSGYPAAIVVREKSVAITTALRVALGDATHVVIGVESRTDRPDGYAAIAIAPVGSDHPWFSHAHKLTKSGEWGAGFRANLGLPNDVYIAERQGEQDLWICRPREWATERVAS